MGGSSPIDDLGNMFQDFIGGAEEMITHDKEKAAADRKVKANKERLEKQRAKQKIAEETDIERGKQQQKRSVARTKQKSKQDTGRKGTILTDELGDSAGDITGTVGGKNVLGI